MPEVIGSSEVKVVEEVVRMIHRYYVLDSKTEANADADYENISHRAADRAISEIRTRRILRERRFSFAKRLLGQNHHT